MEAANRGATDAGGKSVGLNIGLPNEQRPNPWITPDLSFEFHYFFMRKLWFAHLARALVVFPGGFGTLDELMEMLTLMQTQKIVRRIPVVLYGTDYWNEIVNFEALARHGMIDRADLSLFRFADDPATALALIQAGIEPAAQTTGPAIARSRTSG
ncbi:MAG: LOG family protein [Burkholderiales bacterium]|nr:LOG family protein [Burkholderiales bacterium]